MRRVLQMSRLVHMHQEICLAMQWYMKGDLNVAIFVTILN